MERLIIHWRDAEPTPGQIVAWRQFWARLLRRVDEALEIQQPQDRLSPEAVQVDEPDVTNQAAATASIPAPEEEEIRANSTYSRRRKSR